MSIHLDLSKVSRETALKTWLAYHRIGYRELAAKVGVDPSFISYIVQGKRRSRRVLDALRALGVPPELLPRDGDAGRGEGG
ncbi:MAG: helix-turn-helix transcriptional regulator [Thermodesulfobacteriota bacterium]